MIMSNEIFISVCRLNASKDVDGGARWAHLISENMIYMYVYVYGDTGTLRIF